MTSTLNPAFVILPVKELLDEFEQCTKELTWKEGGAIHYLVDASSCVVDYSTASKETLNYMFDLRQEYPERQDIDLKVLSGAFFNLAHSVHDLFVQHKLYSNNDIANYGYHQVKDGALILKRWEPDTEEEEEE